jgi:hypothetical protein
MGDNRNILVGTNGTGADGTGLAWFAVTGSTAPTDASTALAAAWKNVGFITDDGLTEKINTASKDVKAYGSLQIQRKIITDSSVTFNIAFLEKNARTTELYYGIAFNSLSPTVGTGAFSYTFGTYTRQLVSGVFDIVDGTTRHRVYCPQLEVTDRQDVKYGTTDAATFGVTFTAYPNSSGVALQAYDVVPALG